MGGSPSVQSPAAPDPGKEFTSALNAYSQGAGQLYQTESQYQPMYNQMQRQMQQENIQSYADQYTSMLPQMQAAADQMQNQASGAALGRQQQYGAQSYQAMLASNPALSQLSQFSQNQLNAGQDTYLSGLRDQMANQTAGQMQQFGSISAQVGRDVEPVNKELQGLYTQTGQQTAQTVADLTGIRNKFAADPRSDIWKQTQGAVSGQLGTLDPLTQQLSDTAQQQLALGGSLSDAQKQDAVQAARGAYSSRGLLSSNGAIAAEVLGRQSYMQQMLQQREQFATGVDPLVQQQIQQRTSNAMGFSQANEALTQANLGSAADITQNIAGVQNTGTQLQSGLQGQIMGNLQQARAQQASLAGQSVQAQQFGTQESAALQQAILSQQQSQQAMGASGMQYLGGMGAQNLAQILGAPAQGAAYAQMGASSNVYGLGGPSLFENSGMLQMTNQNAMANMNAQGQTSMVNAQAQGAAQGQKMAAGAAVAGTVIMGAVLL